MRHVAVILAATLASALPVRAPGQQPPEPIQFTIEQTVVKMPLAEGVSEEDAIQFLKSKAAELNMKMVAEQNVAKELRARGIDAGTLHIFQFCNPEDAHRMVQYNALFAAYMPCRIALVEDSEGQTWLMMMDLDLLIDNARLPPELRAMAQRISDNLMEIIKAGANASF